MYWYEEDVSGAERRAAQLSYIPETVFYGSSSIRLWDSLYEDFRDYKPANLGFGGSTLEACVYFFERMLQPYSTAKQLVIYAGDNDLGDGKTPEDVLYHFTQLALAIKTFFQHDTQVFYLSIKPSIARWDINEKIVATNDLIAENIKSQFPHIHYVDVYNAMLAEDKTLRADLYSEDGLHLSPKGYEVWNNILQPAFTTLLQPQDNIHLTN